MAAAYKTTFVLQICIITGRGFHTVTCYYRQVV